MEDKKTSDPKNTDDPKSKRTSRFSDMLLQVTTDLPERTYNWGLKDSASKKETTVRDRAVLALFYLLQSGEYIVKSSRNEMKQTKQLGLGA